MECEKDQNNSLWISMSAQMTSYRLGVTSPLANRTGWDRSATGQGEKRCWHLNVFLGWTHRRKLL